MGLFLMLTSLINSEAVISFGEAALASIVILVTLGLLAMSERVNSGVKDEYVKEFGPNSWDKVFLYSLLMGAASGSASAIGGFLWNESFLFYYLACYGTVIGYIGMQAIITDPALHKVDRYMLRIGYVITGTLTVMLLIQSYPNPQALKFFSLPILLTYVVLFLMFLFSNIGASDIRAIIVFLPFLEAAHMSLALITFFFVAALTMAFMMYKKWRTNDLSYAVPILPVLMVPYIFITPIFPLLLDVYRTLSLR